MKKVLLPLLLIAALGFSRTAGPTQLYRENQILIHDINQVEMCISNFGKFGQTETGSEGCWWPTGSGHNYIFGAGIWFGTIDSLTGDTLVTAGYIPSNGSVEFAPGLAGMSVNHPDAIIYMYPSPWPPPAGTFPMAPQTPLSHQDSWCCFNDCDSNMHTPGDTRPIGIEVYQTVYAWDLPALEDIIFFTYDIKNVSGHNLEDCYVSVTTDCDVGNGYDDICTGIVDRTYLIGNDTIFVDDLGYQWRGDDPSTWGVIGFDLFQTPFDLVEGQDKDNDGIPDQYERDSVYYILNVPDSLWDVDLDGVPDWRDASENPQYGMTALKRFTLGFEPNIDPQRYMTLAGYNYQTGQFEPYDTIPSDPDDQRFLMSSGPFELEPDSSVTVVFAVLLADWYNIYQTPDSALALVDATAQLYYDMYWFLYTGIEEYSVGEELNTSLTVIPNPLPQNAKVTFTLTKAGPVSLRLYNTAGQLVKKVMYAHKPAGNHNIDLYTSGLSMGTYFLVLETPSGKTSRSLIVLR